MAPPPKNRAQELSKPSATRNGIDFVEVTETAPNDVVVHFVNTVRLDTMPMTARIDGGDSVPVVGLAAIAPGDWQTDGDGRPLLVLHAVNAGDFSNYALTLTSDLLDLYFSTTKFSFKAFCPSDFDCLPPPHCCPPDDVSPPAIDYLAKDFSSFVRALGDFSAQRYPNWQERSEADFGVMFMEALSALGDDLSYQQDRIAAEATLDTATERRSIERHARLVDYTPQPVLSARALLACNVSATLIPAGVEVRARDPSGGLIPFEIGTGLADTTQYAVDPRWNDPSNPILPYWLDDETRCLSCGATEMWLSGSGYGLSLGQALLIDTAAETSADPPVRVIVHLSEPPFETIDPLFGNAPITRIRWSTSEALAFEHDLTRTVMRGNLVPATQGRRRTERFAVDQPPSTSPQMPVTFARLGANAIPGSPTYDYRFCLREAPLTWLASDDPETSPAPEIRLQQPDPIPPIGWAFKDSLLDADIGEEAFCLERASYRRIAMLNATDAQIDYDGDAGDTILFGNAQFGATPRSGDVFQVDYRAGMGVLGNVAADTITNVDPVWSSLLLSVTNPFAAAGGADRETNEQVRRRAPQAFQARQYRAVLATDYQAEVERLSWVQQAGTSFRWTGSWFTVFTAIDPEGGEELPLDLQTQAIELLNRRRLAGYESYVPLPRYVSIDLDIEICARADAFRGDVERGVLDTLAPAARCGTVTGFFVSDHFTFGTPLERSQVEAAIQLVPGVAGVESIRYRRRDMVPNFVELPDVLPLALDEILRIDNDASRPERGALKITVCGGK